MRAGSCFSMITRRALPTSDTRIRRTPKSELSLMQRDRRLIPASPSAWVASYRRPGEFSRKIDSCFNFMVPPPLRSFRAPVVDALRLPLAARNRPGGDERRLHGDPDDVLDVALEMRLLLPRRLHVAEDVLFAPREDVSGGLLHELVVHLDLHLDLVHRSGTVDDDQVVRRHAPALHDDRLDLGREEVHAADDQHVV